LKFLKGFRGGKKLLQLNPDLVQKLLLAINECIGMNILKNIINANVFKKNGDKSLFWKV